MKSQSTPLKKFTSGLTITLMVVNSLLTFTPAAYADEVVLSDTPSEETSAPAQDTQPVGDESAPSSDEQSPVVEEATPTPTQEPSTSPESSSLDTLGVDQEVSSEEAPTSTASEPEDSVWQLLPNGKALTKEAVNMSTTYVAPQNSQVTVRFTQLPDTPGNLAIQEVKLTEQEQKDLGALSDTAYDITSSMENGSFKYVLTLPKPENVKDVTVKYAEDRADLDNAEEVTQKTTEDDSKVTVSGLNHFTIFYATADTNSSTGTGAYTATTGPVITESATGQITTGTIILNTPSGFEFDTAGVAPTVLVTRTSGSGASSLNINNVASGTSVAITSITTTQITFTVTDTTQGSVQNSLTWQNVRMRPTAGAPLASGDLTRTGTSTGGTFGPNTFTEIAGDPSNTNSTLIASLSSVPADGVAVSTITATVLDQFGNPVSGLSVTLTKTGGPGTPTILTSPTVTDSSGVAVFTVSSTTADTNTFTAEGSTFSKTVDVTFATPSVPSLVSPANGAIIQPSAAILDWTDETNFSTPVTYQYQSSLSNSVGAKNAFTAPIYTSGSLTSSQINATGSADNTYYWQVRACDSLGNCSDWSGPWEVTIDGTAPVIDVHGGVTEEATSPSGAIVTYTAPTTSDAVDGAGVATCAPVSGSVFGLGDTLVTCNATDTAGNAATPTTFTVTVEDTTAPTITILGNNPETVELGGVYTDAGATATDIVDGDLTGSIVMTDTVNPSVIGTYFVYYDVTDTHGNPAPQAVRTVNVADSTAPNVPSLTSPSDGAVIQPSAALLDWTDETDLTGPVTYQYQSSLSNSVGAKNAFTAPIYTSGSLTSSQINATGSADNTYYWQVRACDSLGNCSDWSGPWEVTIDGTAPSTTDSGTDTDWHNTDVTVNLSCTDNLSGCDVIYWSIDSIPTAAVHDGEGNSVTVSTTGVHTIRYFAVDSAGNEESVKTATNTVKIDKVTPNIPVLGAIISPTNNTLVSWTWGAIADADSGLQHYSYVVKDSLSNIIDSGTTTLTTYSKTVTEGIYTFFVRAVDNAGNESTDTSSSITVDTTAPTTPAADNVGGDYYPLPYPFVTLTSNDVLSNDITSDPVTIYYTTDGSAPTNASTPYTTPIEITSDLTLKAIAYDNAGNASAIMTEVYDLAPVISEQSIISSANSNPSSERVFIWTTDNPSTSRVVYGTTSVSDADALAAGSPNYGYTNSSDLLDTDPKVINHTVTVGNLNSNTTYYYRVISSGSPEAYSDEYSFGTEPTQGNPGPNGDSDSSSDSSSSTTSSTQGQVLGAKTTTPSDSSPSTGSTPYTGTAVAVGGSSSGQVLGQATTGSSTGTTPSESPSPSVSSEASPSVSPETTIAPEDTQNDGSQWEWSWWYLLLILIAAAIVWYFLRNRSKNPAL